MKKSAPFIELWGIKFRALTKRQLFEVPEELLHLITANAEIIVIAMENAQFKETINANFASIDGQIPYWVARIRCPGVEIEKLSGSDLVFDFAAFASRTKRRLFLLGGSTEANLRTKDILSSQFRADVVGYAPPSGEFPFPADVEDAILSRIADCRPSVLLVAFGSPKQESWITSNRRQLRQSGVLWAVGVGGALELASGLEVRAPRFLQRIGMEGIWRLTQRPSRWRRFLRSAKFLAYAWR